MHLQRFYAIQLWSSSLSYSKNQTPCDRYYITIQFSPHFSSSNLNFSLFINSKTLAFVSSLLYLVPPPTFHLIFPNIILFSFPSKAFTSEPPFSTYPELRPQWPWPTLSGRTWAGSYIGATSPTRGFSFSTDEDESGEYLLQDRNMSKGVVLGFRK